MSGKHTPGPWWTERSAMTCTHVVYAGDRKLLCYLNYTGNDPQQAESEANAHLMTAAPELLAALKAAQEEIEDQGDHDPRCEWDLDGADCTCSRGRTLETIRAAIEKARGRRAERAPAGGGRHE